jgi:thioredoxin-like negative regulator of GroEL
MAIDVTEASFAQEVVERSRQVPVVLAKVDVDSNQALAARYGVQGIPAVKSKTCSTACSLPGRRALVARGGRTRAAPRRHRGGPEAALDALLDEIENADDGDREQLRRAIVGILSEAARATKPLASTASASPPLSTEAFA